MILLSSWLIADKINLLLLFINALIFIVYARMAYLMNKTFVVGQKQTALSLAINQFNIFQKEFDSFLNEAKNIQFESRLDEVTFISYKESFKKSNGINYIELFQILETIKYYIEPSSEKDKIINDFRHSVLFRLFKFYDKLYLFLIQIKDDQVLTMQYKLLLYNYIERDILQIYFRVSNYVFNNNLHFDLTMLQTLAYDPKTFYDINNFYIDNDIFQYQLLDFYVTNTP